MEKRVHLYVRRNHPAAWLMAVCMAASAFFRIVLFDGKGVWCGAVWPVSAAALYALIGIFAGREMFYKTAIPVWILGVSSAVRLDSGIAWIIAPLLCVCYTAIVSGWVKYTWLLLPLHLLALGVIWNSDYNGLPDLLMVLGMLLLYPGIKIDNDGKWHPGWGDRTDGRRVRTAQVMEQITAYFMPSRNGANNLFSESVEITELERYINRKRKEGLKGFGITHVIFAAYARTVAKYPALNRFIAGQKIYSRGEDIALCMTIKKEMTASAPDSLIKVHLHPGDTAADVYRKFNEKVAEAKNEMQNTTADNTVAGFMMIPGLFLKFAIWLLKTMDYFSLVPAFLLEVSPFHGSAYFTAVGSLGIKPVYHHLYDFGTVPVFCAFGRKRRAEEIENGEIVERKYLDLKFNLDERICDGYYYSSVIKYFLRLLSHPEVLDEPPETIEKDIP